MAQDDRKSGEGRGSLGNLMWVSSVGAELVLCTALGLLAGYWLDSQLGWSPSLTLAGFVLGTAAGGWEVYRAVRRLGREENRSDSRK